jgi:hypothetical protein
MFLFHRGWPADPRTTPAQWQRLHCICKRSIGMTQCSASFWSCSSFLAGVRTPVWSHRYWYTPAAEERAAKFTISLCAWANTSQHVGMFGFCYTMKLPHFVIHIAQLLLSDFFNIIYHILLLPNSQFLYAARWCCFISFLANSPIPICRLLLCFLVAPCIHL